MNDEVTEGGEISRAEGAEINRETMEADVVIVGGGSAGLAAAYQISILIEKHNEKAQSDSTLQAIPDPMIIVLEKGAEVGAHSLSGAVMNPVALKELIPDYKEKDCPIESEVVEDAVYYLTESSAIKAPITPPQFKNKGNLIITLSKFNRWLAQQCEARGINIFPGFAAVEALYEGDKIVGVRTGDKGLDKDRKPKSNFEPGLILKSKVTIFAEGTRGSLFKQVARRLKLWDGKNPEVFEEGVKEIIQMPAGTVKPGIVIHTAGFPLKKTTGGTWIYTMPGDRISLGLVTYLDTKDPLLDPHRELQRLKTHPWIREYLKGGKVVAYGGKTLPSGGYFSMPKLQGDGWMVIGDTASMVNVKKLKGIHLAIKSGMIAAESALETLKGHSKDFEAAIKDSYVGKELYGVRNFQQTLAKGMFRSIPALGLQEITGGRGLTERVEIEHTDAKTTKKVVEVWGPEGEKRPEVQLPKPDNVLFFDKLSSVYLTGTMHDEDSPNHLLLGNGDICRTVCEPQYKSPCTLFCPANVYEMVDKGNPGKDLQINYTNCIHCKTCDIKCPFENIDWTVPEGGGGPRYTEV